MKRKSQSSRLRAHRPATRKGSFFQWFRRWELLIFLAALICDLNSWGHPFMLDDWTQIVGNPILQSPANAAKIFTLPYYQAKGVEEDLYRPLTTLSFALNRWSSGLQPDSFHVVNRLIHIVISLLVFWLLLRLIPSRPRIALFTSLLFAVHPIQSEAITYIGGRGDAMAMLFFSSPGSFIPTTSDLWNPSGFSLQLGSRE